MLYNNILILYTFFLPPSTVEKMYAICTFAIFRLKFGKNAGVRKGYSCIS